MVLMLLSHLKLQVTEGLHSHGPTKDGDALFTFIQGTDPAKAVFFKTDEQQKKVQ